MSITDIKAKTTQPIVLPFLLERLLCRLVTPDESTSRCIRHQEVENVTRAPRPTSENSVMAKFAEFTVHALR
jgi:hypothetical protein